MTPSATFATLLAHLDNVQLTIAVGRYAIDWHLQPPRGATLAELVAGWRQHWPKIAPLPHPSPRNTMWLKRNPWVEDELVPRIRRRVRRLLST